jgi:hypothetical protein
MTKTVKAPRAVRSSKISVSETNIRKAASRLLNAKLVSTEIAFIQRELGASATQEDVDNKIVAVRAMPWASIAMAE